MMRNFDRRMFLESTTLAGVGALLPLEMLQAAGDTPKPDPPFRISLAQWSLHHMLRKGELDNLDFAKFTKSQFGIEAVEYVNTFFQDKAKDTSYLADMKQRAADQGVKSVLIMVDNEGDLGDADPKKRDESVANHHRWVEAAKFLGCHAIRVNARSSGNFQQQMNLAADGLRKLSAFAARQEMNVIVENHGGLSSNGKWLVEVIKKVNLPNCGTLPDFGNFRITNNEWYDRYQGVAEMMPYAKAVSAKSHEFDAQGNEVNTDFPRMMKIVVDAGYHGYVGIEYEGSKLPEVDGIRATQKLLQKIRATMVAG